MKLLIIIRTCVIVCFLAIFIFFGLDACKEITSAPKDFELIMLHLSNLVMITLLCVICLALAYGFARNLFGHFRYVFMGLATLVGLCYFFTLENLKNPTLIILLMIALSIRALVVLKHITREKLAEREGL